MASKFHFMRVFFVMPFSEFYRTNDVIHKRFILLDRDLKIPLSVTFVTQQTPSYLKFIQRETFKKAFHCEHAVNKKLPKTKFSITVSREFSFIDNKIPLCWSQV